MEQVHLIGLTLLIFVIGQKLNLVDCHVKRTLVVVLNELEIPEQLLTDTLFNFLLRILLTFLYLRNNIGGHLSNVTIARLYKTTSFFFSVK